PNLPLPADCRDPGSAVPAILHHRRRGGRLRRNGMPSFDRIRYRRHDASVFMYAFDLIELNGDDLRREPLQGRKATLASVLAKAALDLRPTEHIEADGPTVFAHACKMGLEGIVSKRKTSTYRSGRSPDWLKSKNPTCEAVRREEEEDWGR